MSTNSRSRSFGGIVATIGITVDAKGVEINGNEGVRDERVENIGIVEPEKVGSVTEPTDTEATLKVAANPEIIQHECT